MKEIKFLKDLPLKFLNQNKSYIDLLGGDIYFDKDGNRYAFLTFKNLRKSPIFSLQLSFREYSLEGKLIKDGEFFLPYMYAPSGEFVNEVPIEIDQQTEALEVYIVKVVYDKQKFVNDRLVGFTKVDYIEKPSMAPAKKWEYKSNFEFVESSTPKEAPVQQQKTEEVNPVEAAAAPTLEAEKPVEEKVEQPQEVVSEEQINSAARGTFKKKNLIRYLFPMIAVVVVIIAVVFVSLILIKQGADSLNGF